jgi:hypothetical protein
MKIAWNTTRWSVINISQNCRPTGRTIFTLKTTVFWDVMPCSLVLSYQCFGRNCYPCLLCRNIGNYLPDCHILGEFHVHIACREVLQTRNIVIMYSITTVNLMQYYCTEWVTVHKASPIISETHVACSQQYATTENSLFQLYFCSCWTV